MGSPNFKAQFCLCCNRASKILVRRSIFVFLFSSFPDAKEFSKLRRFLAEDLTKFWTKLVFKNSKICTFLKLWSSIFPKKYKVLLLGEFVQVAIYKTIPFSFENLCIFDDIRRICNHWRSSKNFLINEDSSFSSSVHFQKPKNLHIRLRFIFNLHCNTAKLEITYTFIHNFNFVY